MQRDYGDLPARAITTAICNDSPVDGRSALYRYRARRAKTPQTQPFSGRAEASLDGHAGDPVHTCNKSPAVRVLDCAAVAPMQPRADDVRHPARYQELSMKRLIGLLFLAVALPALAALKAGDAAPDFKAPASLDGKSFQFSLQEQLKKGPVVVYFYPSAYTGGCNLQAHTFAVNHDKFAAAGASSIGVSLDSIERLNQFSADPEYCAGKIAVASDTGGKIARSYDLKVGDAKEGAKDSRGVEIGHGFAERTTFIVTPDGKISATVGGVSPVENVNKSLEIVQQLAAKN
jgi:peroxiredoxin